MELRKKLAALHAPLISALPNKQSKALDILDKNLSYDDVEKIASCIIKSIIYKYLEGFESLEELDKKLKLIMLTDYQVTYFAIQANAFENDRVLDPGAQFYIKGGIHYLDLKLAYPVYLIIVAVLQRRFGKESKIIAELLPIVLIDIHHTNKLVQLLKEGMVNPFAEISVGELGGHLEDDNPLNVFLSGLFKIYVNVSAKHKVRADMRDTDFVTLNNYKMKFANQVFDYFWTANVMSYFASNTGIDQAIAITNDLFKICSDLTSPGGIIIHVTGLDDHQPGMRASCLINQRIFDEAAVIRVSGPNQKDDETLRVNIFQKE